MTRLKKRYWISLSLLLIIILLSLFGWQYWLSFKQKYQLTINWQGISVGFNGLSFTDLTVSQSSMLSLTVKELHISWSNLSAENIDIHWLSDETHKIANTAEKELRREDKNPNQFAFDTQLVSSILHWLPNTINIHSLRFYQQDKPLLDIKVALEKQLESILLNVSTNTQYSANLSAIIAFNEMDSRLEIQNGILTTTINQFGIQNGHLNLPFTGSITGNRIILTNLDTAAINLAKVNISDDVILSNLISKLSFQIESSIPFKNNQLSATAQLAINKLNAIYKNSEIKSVTGNMNLSVKNNQLSISTPSINIQEMNVGVIFEKIKFAGAYSSILTAPEKGIVVWKNAQATIFSGKIFLDKGKLDLAKLPQQVNLNLTQIQLKDILAKYPVEGLVGNGAIDGTLPITLSEVKNKGKTTFHLLIKNGQLTSTNQGYLQFENPALKDYVKNNPKMKILTDILKNFHYTKLTSKVDYANDIAKLGLNIQGSNSDVENGKAVNFNITLEENIAKLMTSLLLSDQISEPIRKRIESRLK